MPDRALPKIAMARRLRKSLTTPEYLLWERLKLRLDDGLVFRRQHPIGAYILDFYCARARLCIEVDGALHDAGRDERRDLWLCEQGIGTYRIPAAEIFTNADAAADGVRLKAAERVRRKST